MSLGKREKCREEEIRYKQIRCGVLQTSDRIITKDTTRIINMYATTDINANYIASNCIEVLPSSWRKLTEVPMATGRVFYSGVAACTF